MGNWDAVFDETYLETYIPFLDEERTRGEAMGAASLAGLEPPADVLDCPCGFGRHATVLTNAGYRVTGLDASAYALDIARRTDPETTYLQCDMRELGTVLRDAPQKTDPGRLV